MGPRSGSPAAETPTWVLSTVLSAARREAGKVSFLLFILGVASSGCPPLCWPASVDDSHSVRIVVVNPGLSISDDTGDFSLTFDRGYRGAGSSTQVVNYKVYGNGMPANALDGVITAKISNSINGIELGADVGGFTNVGTPGNIELREHASGFQEVGSQPVPLADKGATTGTQARVLNGSIPITWQATATEDLSAGQYPVTLTVTLKDS